jgi:hypothetical protein
LFSDASSVLGQAIGILHFEKLDDDVRGSLSHFRFSSSWRPFTGVFNKVVRSPLICRWLRHRNLVDAKPFRLAGLVISRHE